jgi:hypothetical protein
MSKRIFILSLSALLMLSIHTFAANRYWIAGSTANWNSTANWSTASGGASGASVPGNADVAIFDANGTGNCTINATVDILGWSITSGYTGTISQGSNPMTIRSSGATLSGGTFTGGSGTITFVSGACTISGTAFTSTSAAFSTNSNFSLNSGSFTDNGGTMKFTASCTITAATSMTLTMDTMEFSPSAHAAYTIAGAGTINVTKLLRYANSNQIAVGSGTINVQGDISLNNTFSGNSAGGTATIVINGTGTQYINGASVTGQSRLPSITINKNSDTLFLVNSITSQGANFTYTNGTVDAGNSTFWFAGNKTFSGSITLNIVAFGASVSSTYTINAGTVITADSTLQIVGSTNAIFNTGTIHAHDHISVTNTATGGGGTASLIINGSDAQTLTGSGTAGQGRLPNITVNKSNTLTLSSIISVDGAWTYTAGTVSPGTSTVAFYGTYNLDGQEAGSACMPFYNVTINGGTRTLTGHLDCNNNFTISSGTTCSAGSNTIYVGGDWNSVGTWTYSTSTVVFDGTSHNKIKGTGTVNFYNVTVNRSYTAGAPRSVKLQNPVQVNAAMTLTKGRVITDATNYLAFVDNATCTVFNNDSAYVCGPVRKTGNDVFSFPVGDTVLHDSIAYHPLAITAPSSATDAFQVIYYAAAQGYGSAKASTLNAISTCEYWTLNRTAGTSTPTVSLSWNAGCDNNSYSEMRVAQWNGTQWDDLGQNSLSISNAKTGTIAATTASSFTANPAPITIAYTAVTKSYAPVSKVLDGGYVNTDGNILYFQYDEEYKDANGLISFQIVNISNNSTVTLYGFPSAVNVPVKYGTNYFKMDLYTAANTPLSSGMYMLVVTNDKNETWQLMFNKN